MGFGLPSGLALGFDQHGLSKMEVSVAHINVLRRGLLDMIHIFFAVQRSRNPNECILMHPGIDVIVDVGYDCFRKKREKEG